MSVRAKTSSNSESGWLITVLVFAIAMMYMMATPVLDLLQ